MSKNFTFEKPDKNEADIINKLSDIPGIKVYSKYNDLIIGYEKVTVWVEIKNPETACNKDGSYNSKAFTDKQKKIKQEFTGCRIIAKSFNEVVEGMAKHFSDIGFIGIAENLRRFKR